MTVNHILTNLDFSSDFTVRQRALEALTERIAEATLSTRQALLPFAVSADPHQESVIKSPATTIRMVAPAGAGKTQTIINRLLYRIQHGLNPARALLLTFDNAAVNSIRLKLREKLAEFGVELSGLRIQTLNAFGYSILKECFPPEYQPIVESKRQYAMIKELRKGLRARSGEHAGSIPENLANRYLLEFLSLLKNNLFDPRAIDSQALADFLLDARQAEPLFPIPADRSRVTRTLQAVMWLFQGYDRLLQREGVIDFDDQKLRSYLLLQKNPGVLEAVQVRLDEVIVDEFQDINRLDFVLVQEIARKATLVVTGDDDQAIYGFRGCTPEYIIELGPHLERPVESHELQINYRCPPVIVEHADRLIRNNTWRIAKSPTSASDVEAQINVVSSLSAGLEAGSIVSLIRQVREAAPLLGYKDFAVLYRTNAQSLPLQVEFILNGVPFYVRPEHSILHNESLQKLLSILRVKLALEEEKQPAIRDAVRTVVAFFRYVDPQAVERLEAALRRGDFLDNIESTRVFNLLPPGGREILPSAIDELLAADTLLETFNVIAQRFYGVYGMIGSLEDVVNERVPLGEVYEIAANFRGDTREFLQAIESAMRQARASGAGQDHRGGVPLLTYFRSKGLQWHTVILTTCNDGLIPHYKAEVEEERRLFYVAMTRASSNLVVSYVTNACGAKVQPSRFLYEAGLLARPEKPKPELRPPAPAPLDEPKRRGTVRYVPPKPPPPETVPPATAPYIASSKSIVFHRAECRAAKKISPASAVGFKSREDAIAAGKHPCVHCKP